MNDLVDRILNTYQLMRPLDADRVSDSRQKLRDTSKALPLQVRAMPSSWRSMGWHI
jgi:hypothetical protein